MKICHTSDQHGHLIPLDTSAGIVVCSGGAQP
jgi:2',3'-cyclic-nucleotide 2'-phosphodiesterase (5'-nucleotidase family)